MAWYPGAVKMELQPESDQQPAIRPTQFIVHSVVAPWDERRIYEYWRDSTSLESHFGLDYDGSMGQYIGTETRADANASANRRADGSGAVSIETASNTSASDPWTPEQIEALIELGVWLHRTHGIPLRICRTHDDPGFGYHRLFPEWSTNGTACPGDARIEQFRQVVFPGIVARATGQTGQTSEEEEDDMPLYTGLGAGEDMDLAHGTWHKVFWKSEFEDGPDDHVQNGSVIVHGPALVTGAAYLRFSGVGEGQVQARFAEMQGESEVHQHPIVDMSGNVGDEFLCLPITQRLAAGRKLVVKVLAHDSGATDLKLKAGSYVKLLSWKES